MKKSQTPTPLEQIKKNRLPHRDVNKELSGNHGKLDKLALFITDKVGTMGFFFIIFAWTILWLGWNLLAPTKFQFDPAPAFVFWLFISNMVQIFLMPLIMVGQNLQSKHAEERAEYDLEVNIKAEEEIETVLEHLEYQNKILLKLLEQANIKLDDILGDNKPEKK